ncbi:MAG: thiamine phosphate synthase [Sulfuricurvum sp.]|nr:thiamine phosphate synthase [Sulfuricurvum sp.]MDP3021617.1 thiamine phosphate synthase [Sulfuricurvum sp.]
MKSYLITDPLFYGHSVETLTDRLKSVLDRHTPDYALFRDKETPFYPELARVFIDTCRENKVPHVLVHGDALIAYQAGADGVHLTSHQFTEIGHAKSRGLYVVVSTHTHMEALMAQGLGADAVTYSPIFASPHKGEPKGLEDLKAIVDKMEIPIFALGGILSQEQINEVEAVGAYGFASIRYFI